MDELDLQNHSIAVLEGEEGSNEVALVVTPEGYKGSNTFVKKGENSKNPVFTHHFLMMLLASAGIIQIPELDEKGVPLDLEDELLTKDNPNQHLDLVYTADVVDIIEGNEGFMEEVNKGEGMGIYEIVAKEGPEKSESGDQVDDSVESVEEESYEDAQGDGGEGVIEEDEAIVFEQN